MLSFITNTGKKRVYKTNSNIILIDIPIIDNIQFTDVRLISKEGATSNVYIGYIIISFNLMSYRVYNNFIYCLKKYNDLFQNEKVTEHFFREIANLFDTNCKFIVKVFDYIKSFNSSSPMPSHLWIITLH